MNPFSFIRIATYIYLLATTLSFASIDELNWVNSYPNETREDLFFVIYDGNKFIAGGSGGAIWYSENGKIWKRGSMSGNEVALAKATIRNIRYTGKQYYAFGTHNLSAGVVQISSNDGINWHATSQSSGMRDTDIVHAFETFSPMNHLLGTRSIEYGNGRLVRMERNYRISLSENGVDWNRVDSSFAPDIHRLRFLNGNFYALLKDGQIYRSNTGETWELIFDDATAYLADIAFFKGKLFVLPYSPEKYLFTSIDGVSWNRIPAFYGTNSMVALAANNTQMVAVGNNGSILRTVDGQNWTGIRSGSDPSFNYASNGSVLVGLNGYKDSWYSYDGYILYAIEFERERYFSEVAAFKDGFIAYDHFNEELLISSNGKNWTPTAETPEQLKENNTWYIVNNRMFVVPYFSTDLPVTTTTDGSNWSYFEDFHINKIYYGNGSFHASERNGDNVYTSANGLNWTKRISTDDQGNPFHPNLAFYYKAAFYASTNRIYKSSDGLKWTVLVEDDAFPYHYRGDILAVWNGTLIYAGSNGSLGFSSDGIQWTHFEVGASSRVEQIMTIRENIVLDLGWDGLIQSRARDDKTNQQIDFVKLDSKSLKVESKLSLPEYPNYQYGLLLQSSDLRKWEPSAEPSQLIDENIRQTDVNIDLAGGSAAYFRNGYLSLQDLFGSWIGVKTIETAACNGSSTTNESIRYFAEVRRKENQQLLIELLDTEDSIPWARFEGTFDTEGRFDLTVTQSNDPDLIGQSFNGFIGKLNDAPLISLSLTQTDENSCTTRFEINLTR